jgi:hypothetical protein
MEQNDAAVALKIFFLLPESSCISGSAVIFFTHCFYSFLRDYSQWGEKLILFFALLPFFHLKNA